MIKPVAKYRSSGDLLKRISINPKICHGKPCIKGHRVMVHQILDFLAEGASFDHIISEFPSITHDDIIACIEYANHLVRNEEVRIVRK